jgi:hypothetical protein
MARAVGRPSGIRTCRAHCQRTRPHHWRSRSTQSGPRRLGVANGSHKLPTISGFKLVILYVLICNCYPRGVGGNTVLSRDGLRSRSYVVWRRQKNFLPPPVHQTGGPAPPPRTREGGTAPPGGRRRASRRLAIPSVPPVGGWGRPARGEFLAPNSPLGQPPVLLAGFWAAGRAKNPLDFVRWVVPIKARGRYTLCSAIHRAEGVRRVRNGDF